MEKNKKLKVLYLVDNYYPITGGVNTVVSSIAKELQDKIEFSVCSVKYKGYVDNQEYFKVYRSEGYYNFITHDGMAHPSKDFEKTILNENFDILHCHTAGNLLNFALKIGKKQNIPVVSTIHNIYYPEALSYVKLPFLAKLIAKMLFKKTEKSNYVWAVSQFCANYAKKFGVKKPIKIEKNAINMDCPTEDFIIKGQEKINKLHNLLKDHFIFLFVSRIIKGKNLDLVIDSINLLNKDQPNNNIKILVVGDGKYLKKAKKRVKKLKIENYFIFTGMITDRYLLSEYYTRSNVVLFPSVIESIGLIQVEASAYKKPCLVIENVAQSEDIIDNKNGFIAKNNPISFLEKMKYCYNNKNILHKVGEEAYDTLFRSYKDENIKNEILNDYITILDDFKNKKI